MSSSGSKVGFWVAIVVLGVLLFVSGLTNIGLIASLFSGGAVAGAEYAQDECPRYNEIWSAGAQDEPKVVRIGLKGVIMRGRQERLFGYEPDMVQKVLLQIRCATMDKQVKAILLEVDSPGGAVTPSDEIYAALQQFKRDDEERLVMVFIRDLGASGAYYAAMAGDYIIAEPTAIIGSVGVIMQSINMQGLGEKLGLSSVTIASGKNKDMLNPFEAVDPKHVALLQDLVNSMQDRFAGIVMKSRGLDSRELLDGRVFNVIQAREHNLIDGVGYWQDAVDKLKMLMDVEDLYIVRYSKPRGFLESLFEAHAPNLPSFEAIHSPRMMYLWKP